MRLVEFAVVEKLSEFQDIKVMGWAKLQKQENTNRIENELRKNLTIKANIKSIHTSTESMGKGYQLNGVNGVVDWFFKDYCIKNY